MDWPGKENDETKVPEEDGDDDPYPLWNKNAAKTL